MSLLDLVGSPEVVHQDVKPYYRQPEFEGKKVIRIQKAEWFYFRGENGIGNHDVFNKFDELLSTVDYSDIMSINFSSDLSKCCIIYYQETLIIPRELYNENLPKINEEDMNNEK